MLDEREDRRRNVERELVFGCYGAGRRGFQRNRCATLWIQAGLVVQLVAAKRLRRGSGGRVDDGRFWASIPRPLRP